MDLQFIVRQPHGDFKDAPSVPPKPHPNMVLVSSRVVQDGLGIPSRNLQSASHRLSVAQASKPSGTGKRRLTKLIIMDGAFAKSGGDIQSIPSFRSLRTFTFSGLEFS
jgi:hypothetical protein